MKKTHRALLSILLVLTLLTALPLTVMAEGEGGGGTPSENVNTEDNAYLSGNYDGNTATGVTVNKDGEVGANTGSINYNYGEVTYNGTEEGGVNSGKIGSNLGKVDTNYGTIDYVPTKGSVRDNEGSIGAVPGGTVNVNNGTIGSVPYGNVNTNNHMIQNVYSSSIVGENNGEIDWNQGTVETNNINGTVTNTCSTNDDGSVVYAEGTVTTNFGTVYQNNSTTDGTTTTTNTTTYYGLHGEDEDGNKYYYVDIGENESDNTAFLGYQASTEVDLDRVVSQYKREGYKLVSYKPYTYNKESNSEGHLEPLTSGNPIFVGKENNTGFNSTSYCITAPTLLKLTWEKIASIFTPAASTDSSVGGGGGAEAVELSAGKRYIGLGSVIFINEKGYKVVEIKDDAYVVVSFDALPDEDVQDLDALYAKLFTPEQQKLIKNVGQLLDSEDVLTVFGTPGNHPVYEISKDLVK